MRTAQIFYLTVVAFFAVVIVFQSLPSEPVGQVVKQPWAIYVPNAIDIRNLIIPKVGFAVEKPAMPKLPDDKAKLIPGFMSFYVNTILVPADQSYNFLPLKKDDMRTFSGKFGPYPEDYSDLLTVELCSFVSSQPEMIACEKVRDLNYIDGYLTFARGYDWDEYIGGMAMRNFGAFYRVKSQEFGEIAKSNSAVVELV